ncbi:MAG: SRPBCC domain-containing protein [Gemmatimonadota bacterium]
MKDSAVTRRPSEREVVFTRLLDAPVEKVWRVWTDPVHLNQWFGPDGFTITTHEFAFEPGGVWRFIMHGPDGVDYPTRIVFRDIVAPRRLAYDNGWDLPGAPLDFTVVVTLVPEGKQTALAIHLTFADAEAMKTAVERYGVLEGGAQTLGRIAVYLGTVSQGSVEG